MFKYTNKVNDFGVPVPVFGQIPVIMHLCTHVVFYSSKIMVNKFLHPMCIQLGFEIIYKTQYTWTPHAQVRVYKPERRIYAPYALYFTGCSLISRNR